MIRGVVFDLGGTLIFPGDFERGNAEALAGWLRARGFAVPEGFVEALIAERQRLWAERTGTEEVTADRALRAVLERYALPTDAAFLADAERAFFASELEAMRPLPGAAALLARLARGGLRAGLISNASSHYLVVECCRRLLFAPYLDPILSSAGFGRTKPDPRIFHAILRQWRLRPDETVMVGDSLSADVAGAAAAGMRSIWLTATLPPDATAAQISARPDAVARSLLEVGEILDRWREEGGRHL
ncbi:MAG TPA: HAD family hydrolase [bacterium]|nr:HAD family hydrolase [bacterium]